MWTEALLSLALQAYCLASHVYLGINNGRIGIAAGHERRKRLSRAGGTATPLGENVVLTGGILREGGKDTDVIVINLRTLTVTW